MAVELLRVSGNCWRIIVVAGSETGENLFGGPS